MCPDYAAGVVASSHTDASAGHPDRTKFTVLGTSHQTNAREMVETSAALALDRVRAFVDVVDHY
jgi:hypothetical protein